MALPRPELALVSIELGLVVRFSSKEGVLWIQAQLTDNSWLLNESVPFALVFSKADTVKPGLLQKHVELFQEKIAAWCVELPRIFTTSAETRIGRRELLAFIGETLAGVGSFA